PRRSSDRSVGRPRGLTAATRESSFDRVDRGMRGKRKRSAKCCPAAASGLGRLIACGDRKKPRQRVAAAGACNSFGSPTYISNVERLIWFRVVIKRLAATALPLRSLREPRAQLATAPCTEAGQPKLTNEISKRVACAGHRLERTLRARVLVVRTLEALMAIPILQIRKT